MESYNKYEHSVMPSLDYQFANEYYKPAHPWYSFKEAFCLGFLQRTNMPLKNLKIEIHPGFYNIYLYLDEKDYMKLRHENTSSFIKDKKILNLLRSIIDTYKPIKIENMRLNPNGISINNYDLVTRSFVISKNIKSLEKILINTYVGIEKLISFDDVLYVLFIDKQSVEEMYSNIDIKSFKQLFLDVLNTINKDIFTESNLFIYLDDYNTYSKYGRHYFEFEPMYRV